MKALNMTKWVHKQCGAACTALENEVGIRQCRPNCRPSVHSGRHFFAEHLFVTEKKRQFEISSNDPFPPDKIVDKSVVCVTSITVILAKRK